VANVFIFSLPNCPFSACHHHSISEEYHENIIEILMWFAFLGIAELGNDEPRETYIYDVFYDIRKLKRLAKDFKSENTIFSIHKAFWPFLDIDIIDYRRWLASTQKITRRNRGGVNPKGDSQLGLFGISE
jgi:hypothetical protein